MKRLIKYSLPIFFGLFLGVSWTQAALTLDGEETLSYTISPSGKYLFVTTYKSPYARVSAIATDNPNRSVVIGAYGAGKGPPQVLVSSDDKRVYVLSWPAVHDSEMQGFRHLSGLEFKEEPVQDPSVLPRNQLEEQLNVIYQLLKRKLRAPDQEILVAEEKEWLANREKVPSEGDKDEFTTKRINTLASLFLMQVAPNSVL